jgi:FAD/FMN-containing dehydrogenase
MAIGISTRSKKITGQQLSDLRAAVAGEVITPQDAAYETQRMAWNRVVDQRPALIVVAQSKEDIIEAVCFAREQGLEIAIQATGHGVIREANDCLLIVTSRLTGVQVNPADGTAWISAGTQWGQVLAQTQEVGLAPLLGSSPNVGAVGYTLGGGMGWLARKYGLSADSVNRFELVTADGRLISASQEEHPDLFWGLRGGGGNFGVVTGMEVRLYPVTTVYGGNLYYPADKAKEVYARYRQWIANAPEELTSSVVVMNFPPFPQVPEFLRGKTFVMVRGCYSGPVEEGEKLLSYWRDWQAPLMDDFKAMPFSSVAAISNDPVNPGPSFSSGAWLKDLDDEVVDTLLKYVLPQGGPPLLIFAEVRHAGGAIAKVDPHSDAYGNRDAFFSLQVVGAAPTPESHTALRQHADRLKEDLKQHLHGGIYLNFVEGAEARASTRKGYLAENYARLQSLKAKYDPQNRFSHSYDIPPGVETD